MENAERKALKVIVESMLKAATGSVDRDDEWGRGHACGLYLAAKRIATEMDIGIDASKWPGFGSWEESVRETNK